MDVTKVPFNQYVGIKFSTKQGYILESDDLPHYMNHVGTVHAGVEFALAEATSGQFLISNFSSIIDASAPGNKTIKPVVKNAELDYKKPARGNLFSKAGIEPADVEKLKADLASQGRGKLKVNVQLFDSNDNEVFLSSFTWYFKIMNN